MYARERVRPQLYDMDQEKLSRLFVDLRRESLATGSYPITIRHLESMIRMAEASAKMCLREYVRADDIDMAISVAVGSFVSTQKLTIKKTLERVCGVCWVVCEKLTVSVQSFRKYLTQARDYEELLAFILGQLVKEKARFHQLQRHEQPDLIAIKVSELEERVRDKLSICHDDSHLCRERNTTSMTYRHSCIRSCLLPMGTSCMTRSSRNGSKIDLNLVLPLMLTLFCMMYLSMSSDYECNKSVLDLLYDASSVRNPRMMRGLTTALSSPVKGCPSLPLCLWLQFRQEVPLPHRP